MRILFEKAVPHRAGLFRRRACGIALLALLAGGSALAAALIVRLAEPNEVAFPPQPARFVRLLLQDCRQGQPCLDELEIYGPDGRTNLALASAGAKATASSLLPGYAIHQVAHLNDGRYGNSHSWIAAGTSHEWAQIELPQSQQVCKLVFSRDRKGRYQDRIPGGIEVRLSDDGVNWRSVARLSDVVELPEGPLREEDFLRYAFAAEDANWRKVDATDALRRVLQQMEGIIERFAGRGMDVSQERAQLAELRRRERIASKEVSRVEPTNRSAPSPQPSPPMGEREKNNRFMQGQAGSTNRDELANQARLAKRRLFLREPALAAVERVLFVKRQPYEPSHNYSDIFDPRGAPGGSVCVLDTPNRAGRLEPGQAKLTTLFEAKNGVARDPVASFDGRLVWFGYRASKQDFFHLWRMNADGTRARQVTDGPFHDDFPCPLPDGGLAFMSTRCKARFLCWRPQAFVLFRMDAEGGNMRPLSLANLSEWTPSVMRDGRLLWMRSEYLDKGANFGHTLWAIHPDGSQPELVFGNNTANCYAGGREVPGTSEIVCTLVSHGGDLNGPIALVDPRQGRFNPKAITNLTPDVAPQYDMNWLRQHCFRDPFPISHDYFLCSHAPVDKFGLYLIDRWGNRELLHLDPNIGSMAPTLLRPTTPPPVLTDTIAAETAPSEQGQFIVADVYRGLEPKVRRGMVKYLRVCQEVRANLRQLANGEYQQDHEPFMDWYATPVHLVSGSHGWPSYVAKGDLGLVRVEADGSANFLAPAGKVLYFEALDENFTELQRMRSVVQLQPGEKRSCIGCHDDRMTAPPPGHDVPLALRGPPKALQPPPWGAGPFAYEKTVQPVWDAKCVRCHDAKDKDRINLTGTLDAHSVPASYRTIIERGWVDYFDWGWAQRHKKAEALTFGTLKSRLWQVVEAGHYEVKLTRNEMQAVKTWIDLNCPLWPDYLFRAERPALVKQSTPP